MAVATTLLAFGRTPFENGSEAILEQFGLRVIAAQQASDGVSAPVTLAVAQVSQSFGPGPFRAIEVTA